MRMVSLSALRTVGKRRRSPIFIERSYLSCSKPQEPAKPQHPESGTSKSRPSFEYNSCSAFIPIIAFWWQWPCTTVLRFSLGRSKCCASWGEELAQGEGIPAQPPCVFVVGKHAGKLIPEGRHTARLEPNNGNTFPDVGTQVLHKPLEEDLRGVEHAVVEERTPAAEWLLRH